MPSFYAAAPEVREAGSRMGRALGSPVVQDSQVALDTIYNAGGLKIGTLRNLSTWDKDTWLRILAITDSKTSPACLLTAPDRRSSHPDAQAAATGVLPGEQPAGDPSWRPPAPFAGRGSQQPLAPTPLRLSSSAPRGSRTAPGRIPSQRKDFSSSLAYAGHILYLAETGILSKVEIPLGRCCLGANYFAVLKSNTKARAIFDTRPLNLQYARPPPVQLPTPSRIWYALNEITLAISSRYFVNGDFRNWFYQIAFNSALAWDAVVRLSTLR